MQMFKLFLCSYLKLEIYFCCFTYHYSKIHENILVLVIVLPKNTKPFSFGFSYAGILAMSFSL